MHLDIHIGLPTNTSPKDDSFVKEITFGNEKVVSEKGGELEVNKASAPSAPTGVGCGGEVDIGGVDRELVVRSLKTLKKSLDDQREKVMYMLAVVEAGEIEGGGDDIGGKEEQLMQVIEKLRLELENEKRKKSSLEMELEFLKLHFTSTCDI